MQPQFEIQRSHSSTLFELKHAEEVLYSDETDVMQALMRQEEERRELCKRSTSKLLKQQMRRFTRSSRNLFNLLNRSEDSNNSSKFLDDYQTSPNSSGFLLQPTVSQLPKAIMTELVVRKNVRKTHKIKTKLMPKPVMQRAQAIGCLGEKAPQIVRSISEDLAIAAHKNNENLVETSHLAGVTEYQENARSTPNIDKEELCITRKNNGPYMTESSWYSLDGADETSSSTTEEDDFDRKEIDEEEHAKILELLQCGSTDELNIVDDFREEDGDEEDALNKNEQLENDENAWIQPGENDDGDEGINSLPRHTVMDELKSFSHHFQVIIKLNQEGKVG